MVAESKAKVRREVLRRREAQRPDLRAAWSRSAQDRFLELEPVLCGSSIALYSPVQGEVDTSLIFERARRGGKQVAFPVALPDECRLEFHRVDDLAQLVPGAYGIPAPRASERTRIDPSTIDVIAVPGIAFDRQGRRLGYGGGYYDRLLGASSTRPGFVVGVAFEDQMVDEVPHDERDASMDSVVTELSTYSPIICVEAGVIISHSAYEGV